MISHEINVKQHPLMEIIARKLSGIEGVPRSAQTRMVSAACRAARKWHEAEIERLRDRVKELEEKLRTQEYFDKNYTVIDDIGPLPKCFRCRHQQSMVILGADAPCYHCRIADGYPKFEEDAQ